MITKYAGKRVATALLGSATALLGSGIALAMAAPATAAPHRPASVNVTQPASVTVGNLVLEPTARGFQGSLPITVTNTGTTPNYFAVDITEPVSGSSALLDPASPCGYGYDGNLRVFSCGVPGDDLEPNEQRSFTMTFTVLVTPRPYAMIVNDSAVTVSVVGSGQVADTTSYDTRFRSTSGSLSHPQPYVQDTQADAGITTPGQLTLTRQPDGTFAGRMAATARSDSDAGHDFMWAESANLPAGVQINGTDPQDAPSFFTWFSVPGGRFMPAEERTFDVLFTAPEETPVGALGTATYQLSTRFGANDLTDADPTDNVTSFTVTTVEAS